MRPKAILFDLDDTILADDVVYETAWEEVFKVPFFQKGTLDIPRLRRDQADWRLVL
jgi:beta-phosphoglucomutase-like phosphatase (HAD superfamily)